MFVQQCGVFSGEECSWSARGHIGMFKRHVCFKPAQTWSGCQELSLECAAVLLTSTGPKIDRRNWCEMSQHELKGNEMKRKRRKENGRTVPKFETRAQLRSSGKMMEVCHSSYRQNLFLDPIAVYFLNLETSATRLARDLLVYVCMYVCMYVCIYVWHVMSCHVM